MTDEEWRPVVGFEGYYEVSSLGRVRSLDRVGVDSRGRDRFRKGRTLKPGVASNGYDTVNLGVHEASIPRRNYTIHRLVCEAFHGAMPFQGAVARHLNDVRGDNRAENLSWGSSKDNYQDAINNGGRVISEVCGLGHPKPPEGHCRECNNQRVQEFRNRHLGSEPPAHGSYYAYVHFRCRCDACREANSAYSKKKYAERKVVK